MRLPLWGGIRVALACIRVNRDAMSRAISRGMFGGRPRLECADFSGEPGHIRRDRSGAFIGAKRIRRAPRVYLGVAQGDEKCRITGFPAKRVVAGVDVRVDTTGVEVTLDRRCRRGP